MDDLAEDSIARQAALNKLATVAQATVKVAVVAPDSGDVVAVAVQEADAAVEDAVVCLVAKGMVLQAPLEALLPRSRPRRGEGHQGHRMVARAKVLFYGVTRERDLRFLFRSAWAGVVAKGRVGGLFSAALGAVNHSCTFSLYLDGASGLATRGKG